MRFEWDPDKAARNEELHGVTFDEARELFTTDAVVLEIYDVEHSESEDRFKSIGPIREDSYWWFGPKERTTSCG